VSNPNPGWYPDSNNPSQVRYWDGQRWTEHSAPASQVPTGPGAPGAHGGATGTTPPGDQKNWFLRHKILTAVLAFVLIAIIAGAIGGGGSDDDPETASDDTTAGATEKSEPKSKSTKEAEPEPEPEPEAMKVQAGQILKDFESNEAAADGKYSGKTLLISGVVSKVDTELFDDEEYIVQIGSGGQFEFLTVNCDDQSSEDVSSLQKGDDITVLADFEDGGDLGVELKDCSIQ
jgi:hypothetical protein